MMTGHRQVHSLVPAADEKTLAERAEHADVIRFRSKRVVGDVIEIGRRLALVKDGDQARGIAGIGHGNWLSWLKREFGWTVMTATRCINVFDMSKSNKLLDLNIPLSGLYLLASPSTPDEVREKVIEQVESGNIQTLKQVEKAIAGGREPKKTTTEAAGTETVTAGTETVTAGTAGTEMTAATEAIADKAPPLSPDDKAYQDWLKEEKPAWPVKRLGRLYHVMLNNHHYDWEAVIKRVGPAEFRELATIMTVESDHYDQAKAERADKAKAERAEARNGARP